MPILKPNVSKESNASVPKDTVDVHTNAIGAGSPTHSNAHYVGPVSDPQAPALAASTAQSLLANPSQAAGAHSLDSDRVADLLA